MAHDNRKKQIKFTSTSNRFGEIYIKELAGQLFTEIDSQTTYNKDLRKSFLEPDSFIVVAGTDSGLLPKYLESLPVPDSTRIVFIELPEILDWLKKENKLPALPENIAIVNTDNLKKQFTAFDINHYILQDRLFFIKSPCCQRHYYPQYKKFSDSIHSYIKSLHWNIRVELDKKDFIIGQLENVADNRIPSSILHEKFAGMTAILLAGGPSLSSFFPWIKKNRQKIIVVAVSRVAKQLLNNDITPDFFVTVHTQPISFAVSKEMLLFHEQTFLINHAQACPQLIGQWRGKKVFMGHLFPWESSLNGPSKDLVGPTVSHAAYDIILKMGFKTIVLAGVDLCFSKADRSHSADRKDQQTTSKAEGGDVQVVTNKGRIAETSFAFQRGIIEFGKMVTHAKKLGCRTINPSLTSAMIEGVEVTNLENLELGECNNISNLITNATEESDNHIKNHCRQVISELNKAKEVVQHLRHLALEGFQSIQLKEESSTADSSLVIDQCIDIVSNLKIKKNRWLYNTLESFEINLINALPRPIGNQTNESDSFLQFYKYYFTAMIVAADRLNKHISQAIQRAEVRFKEVDFSPEHLSQLCNQWQIDQQPGRASILLNRHLDLVETISQEDRQQLEYISKNFKDIFEEKKSSDLQLRSISEWNHHRLEKLRNRIFEAYNSQNKEVLEGIINSLSQEKSTDPESHLLLAKGLLLELDNDKQKALQSYHSVVENGESSNSKILEDSLSRIASISISQNDLENAKLALQCLTDLSLAHAPTYAEFLYLSGEIDQSLEIYAQYLGQVPDDLKTMLKLGNIYKKLNSIDGVKMVVDYVLERDPANQTALNLLKTISH